MKEKECISCHAIKSLECFYKNPTCIDGRLNQCRDCVCKNVRDYKAKNKDKVREYQIRYMREYIKTHKYKHIKRIRGTNDGTRRDRWANRNPLKVAVHIITSHAIRSGKLKRLPCSVCGDLKSQAHHDNYDFPLKVRWLCSKHHSEFHNKVRTKDKTRKA